MNLCDLSNTRKKKLKILTAFEFIIWDDWAGYSGSLKLSSESVSFFVDWRNV
jgi:hypothetical protein